MLFVDRRVADFESLVAGATAEVIILDPDQDSIAQISQALAGRQGLSSIHIVSHGNTGDLLLGQSGVNQNNLGQYEDALIGWRSALSEDADILLYGCDVGQGAGGQGFIQRLADLTGADVAASDDLTGTAALGGDWDLEVQSGDIEAKLAIADQAQRAYQGTLDIINVTTTADDGAGSLRAAIVQANLTAESDTIVFSGTVFEDNISDSIYIDSELAIDSTIAINGTGTNKLTISGDDQSRLFNVSGDGNLALNNVTLSEGYSDESGGGILNDGILSLTNSRVTFSSSDDDGGGIYNRGVATLSNSTIDSNYSLDDGGGIRNDGVLNIINSTMKYNMAENDNISSDGGGLINTIDGIAIIINSTISSNDAGNGGAIQNDGTLTIRRSTITNNTATNNVGGVNNSFNSTTGEAIGTTNIQNTIIAGNIDYTINAALNETDRPDVSGGINAFDDRGGNLIGNTSGTQGPAGSIDFNRSTLIGSSTAPIDAKLNPLADNGGPTQTHTLQANSLAIDAGITTGTPSTDQRGVGFARVRNGRLDIGATESNPRPTTADATVSAVEDILFEFLDSDFPFFDAEDEYIEAVQIVSLPIAGQLFIDSSSSGTTGSIDANELVVAGQIITTENLSNLRFKPATNANGDAYASFTFKVSDGSNFSADTKTMTINVAALDDAPTLTLSPAGLSFSEAPGSNQQASPVRVFKDAATDPIEVNQTITDLTLTIAGLADGSKELISIDGKTIALGSNSSGTTTTNGFSYSVTLSSTIGGTIATISLNNAAGISPALTDALIDGITYQNTNRNNPTPGDRIVSIIELKDSGISGDANGDSYFDFNTATFTALSAAVTVIAINDAPQIGINQPTVSVNEGQLASNSGTFRDLEGQAVSLTASIGAIVRDTINGTWTWSLTTGDSSLTGTYVTITADDGTDQTTSGFNLIVNNVAPTATLTNGGSVTEGSNGSVSFSNSADVSADVTAGFHYAYDFNNDGTWDNGDGTYAGSSSDSTIAVPGSILADGGLLGTVYPVKARIIDKDGGFTDLTTDITVTNLAPIGSASASLPSGLEDTTYTIAASDLLIGFSDVPGDTLAVRNLGLTTPSNGTLIDNNDSTYSFTPASNFNGLVGLSYTVTDNEGGSIAATQSVQIAALDDAPSLITTAANSTFTEGPGSNQAIAVPVFASATVSTIESGQTITSMTLTVAGLADGIDELLQIGGTTIALDSGSGPIATGITYSVTLGTGANLGTATIVISNPTGFSEAALNTLITGITYQNSNTATPTSGNRTVTITELIDSGTSGNGNANTASLNQAAIVTVIATNEAPTIAVSSTSISGPEGSLITQSGTFDDEEGNGTVTLSASIGSIVKSNDGTWTWSYNPTDSAPTQAVIITATDDQNRSATTSFQLTVTNVAPTATLSNGGSVNEGSSGQVTFSNSADASSDDQIAGFRYAYDFNNDGTWDLGDGTYAGSATSSSTTVAASYLADGGVLGTAYSIKARILDKDGGFTDKTTTITVNNVAPSLSGPAAIWANGTEDTTYTIATTNLLQGYSDVPSDSLSISNVTSNQGTIVATSTGYEFTPIADFNGSVTIAYQVNDEDGGSTPASLSFLLDAVNDAPIATPAIRTQLSAFEDTPIIFSLGAMGEPIVLSDVDLSGGDLSVTVAATSGKLTLASITDLAFSSGDGSGDSTMTFTGNLAAVNAAIAALTYQGNPDFAGSDSINFSVSDLGGTGSGGAKTLNQAIAVSVTAINDAPTLTATALNPSFTEAAGLNAQANAVSLFSSADSNTIEAGQTIAALTLTIAGLADGSNETIVIDGTTISLGNPSSGATARMIYGLTIDSITQVATLVLSDPNGVSPTLINGIVNGITYQNTNRDNPTAGPRVITLTGLRDNGGTSNGGDDSSVLSLSSTVTVTGLNDAPTLTTTSAASLFTEASGTAQAAAVPVFATAIANPIEGNQRIQPLTFTVAGLVDGANETIAVDGQQIVLNAAATGTTTSANYNVTIDSVNQIATIVLSSSTGFTPATLNGIITGITYQNTNANNPTGGDRTVTLTQLVDSGTTGSGNVNTTTLNQSAIVTVAAVNDAPTIAAASSSLTIDEGTTAIQTGTFSDFEGNGTVTLTTSHGFVSQNNSTGTWEWQFSPADSVTTAIPVTITATDSQSTTSNTTFNLLINNVAPTATFSNGGSVNEGSSGTVSFSNQADVSGLDQSSGFRYAYDFNNDGIWDLGNVSYASSIANSSVTVPSNYFADGAVGAVRTVKARIFDKDGGFSDYSTAIAIANVAPTLTGSSASLVNGTEDTTYAITTASLIQGFSDVANDTLSVSDVTSNQGTIIATATGYDFTPNADFNGAVTIDYQVNDEDGGSTLSSQTFTIVAVNDAPIASPAIRTTLSATEDMPITFSLGVAGAPIVLSDVDLGSGDLSVTLSAVNGKLSLSTLVDLTFITGDGTSDATMTFTGNLAAVNAAIAALTYQSNVNSSGSDSITINISDLGGTGSGGAKSLSQTIAVTLEGINDAPTATAIALNPSFTEASGPSNQAPSVALFSNATTSTMDPGQGIKSLGFTVSGIKDGDAETITLGGTALRLGHNETMTTESLTCVVEIDDITQTATITVTHIDGMTTLDANALINSLTYQNTNRDNPTSGDRIVRLTDLQDNGGVANGGLDRSTPNLSSTVTVGSVNDAPVITVSNVVSVNENVPGAIIADLTTVDPDSNVTYQFKVGGVIDNRFEVFNGKLKLKTGERLDYETEASLNLEVIANDGSVSDSTLISIVVNNQVESLTISGLPAAGTDTFSGRAITPIPVTIGSPDGIPGNFTVTFRSSNTRLVPLANISVSGTGLSRTLNLTPAALVTGTATITMVVTEIATGLSTEQQLVVRVKRAPRI